MNKPTPEEIAQAKADALKRFGRDELLGVELGAPIDFFVFLAPLNLARFSAIVDAQAEDMITSYGPAVLDALVWPAPIDWLEVARRRPAAARKACLELLKRAGREDEGAKVKQLAELVAGMLPPPMVAPGSAYPEGERLVAPGLTEAKARALLRAEDEREEPRELWAVWAPGLSCVMIAPGADVYLASQAAVERAKAKRSGITEARISFAKESIVWSDRAIDVVLDDRPSISSDLWTAWSTMGGEVADATSRSF
jgi:hypothetical protein